MVETEEGVVHRSNVRHTKEGEHESCRVSTDTQTVGHTRHGNETTNLRLSSLVIVTGSEKGDGLPPDSQGNSTSIGLSCSSRREGFTPATTEFRRGILREFSFYSTYLVGSLGLFSMVEDLRHLDHAEQDHIHGVSQIDVPVVAAAARVYLIRHHFLRKRTRAVRPSVGGGGGGGRDGDGDGDATKTAG